MPEKVNLFGGEHEFQVGVDLDKNNFVGVFLTCALNCLNIFMGWLCNCIVHYLVIVSNGRWYKYKINIVFNIVFVLLFILYLYPMKWLGVQQSAKMELTVREMSGTYIALDPTHTVRHHTQCGEVYGTIAMVAGFLEETIEFNGFWRFLLDPGKPGGFFGPAERARLMVWRFIGNYPDREFKPLIPTQQ